MKILVCIVILFASLISHAQDYHIINVKGKVSIAGKQGILKPNEKIKGDDKLVFSSKTDAVAVVNPKTGRFVISPMAQKKDSELVAYVKDAITPGTKKLSTRSGLFNNAVDFSQFFKDTVLMLPKMMYATSYKQTEKNFFFIRFNYDGEEISKKLSASSDTLIIVRDDLYSIDKKPIDPAKVVNMRLLYLQDSEIHLITTMKVNSPTEAELLEAVKILKELYPPKQVQDEAMSYLTERYGKVDEMSFTHWCRSIN